MTSLKTKIRAQRWSLAAKVLIVLGFLTWIPNLVFQVPLPLYLLTFPLGTFAFICAAKSRCPICITLSILLFCSMFLMAGIAHLLQWLRSFAG